MTIPSKSHKGGSMGKKIVILFLSCACGLMFNVLAFSQAAEALSLTQTTPNELVLTHKDATTIPLLTGKSYEIHTADSALTLCGLNDFSFSDDSDRIVAYKSQGAAGQKWRLAFSRDGSSYIITNCATQKVLEVTPFTNKVHQADYTGASTQRFRFTSIDKTNYFIVSLFSNKYLTLGAELYLSDLDRSVDQQFCFTETSEGITNDELLDLINSAESDDLLTSFGGMQLSDERRIILQSAIDEIRDGENDLGFIVIDLSTGEGISYNPDFDCHPASTVKAPYIASLACLQPETIDLWPDSMEATIRHSSNDAYDFLWMTYGAKNLEEWFILSEVDPSVLFESYPRYTPRDLAKLWVTIYSFFSSGSTEAALCASWYTSSECSALYEQLSGTYKVYTKPGWEYDDFASTNDAGIVWVNGKPYLVSIMTNMPGDFESLQSFVDSLRVVFETDSASLSF